MISVLAHVRLEVPIQQEATFGQRPKKVALREVTYETVRTPDICLGATCARRGHTLLFGLRSAQTPQNATVHSPSRFWHALLLVMDQCVHVTLLARFVLVGSSCLQENVAMVRLEVCPEASTPQHVFA